MSGPAYTLRKIIPYLILLTFLHPAGVVSAEDTELEAAAKAASTCSSCESFNRLNTLVRDNRIKRSEAQGKLTVLLGEVREWYYANGGLDYPEQDWIFPLKGFDLKAVGGGKRHGYLPGGYDYFDGNRHKGHPSYDIFIHDSNRNDRDDRTGDFVQVLSLTGGIVVAAETSWHPGSPLRGGKYLWVYDPASNSLVYYAHNHELLATVGAMVKPGDPLALVGRTGLNAFKKRSPTHLHLTLLRLHNNSLVPVEIYPQLSRARTVR